VFLSLEPALIPLSIHFPRPYDDPRNTEPGDRPYQLCACAIPMGCNPEIEALTETDIVPRVMELKFEMDQIDVHLHGYLQTKKGRPDTGSPSLLLNLFIGLLLDQIII
jgi:hypothetical protein